MIHSTFFSFLIALLGTVQLSAQALSFELTPDTHENPTHGNGDYAEQLIKRFAAELESNAELKKQFRKYEFDSIGEPDGRYQGISVTSFMLHHSENVDFSGDVGDVGKRNYTQTIILYYSYGQGFRKGYQSTKGLFARFELIGEDRFEIQEKDGSKLLSKKVTATFSGFSKTLHADRKENSQK